eukprot:792631_1
MSTFALCLILIISVHMAHSNTVYSNGDITTDSTSTLYQGDSIESYNSLTQLKFGSNGALKIQTRSSSTSTWTNADFNTATSANHVTLQGDGELVVFNASNQVQWTSNSIVGTAPFRLIVSKDAAAYILDSSDMVVWSTNPSYSELETIWHSTFDYDDGSWALDPDVSADAIALPSVSSVCPHTPDHCLRVTVDNAFHTHAERTTVISAYKYIQFQVDISGRSLESNEFCEIWWSFDDGDWFTDDTEYITALYRDVIIDISLPTSHTSLTISLEIDSGSSSNDMCYFDDAILRGIPWSIGQVIWSDTMNNNDNADWSEQDTAGARITFGSDGNGPDGSCAIVVETSSIDRVTDVSDYIDITLHVDLVAYDLEPREDDHCQIAYSYGGTSFVTTNYSSDGTYSDQLIAIPDPSSQTMLTVRLAAVADSSNDFCFWDNVSLRGTLVTQSPTQNPITPAPTSNPTLNPTRKPTPHATPNPTRKPTPNPTPNHTSTPTKQPTLNPTHQPTPNPTFKPTEMPTPRPTNPVASTCDDTVNGEYNGLPVTFAVNLPFDGNLQFDASTSDFPVTEIEAYTNLNIELGTDTDNDEKVTIYNAPAGNYKFIISGGTQSGTFEARISCFTPSPTAYPLQTPEPVLNPTKRPTAQPITTKPTLDPTSSPVTVEPSSHPSTRSPTQSPTQPRVIQCGDDITGAYSQGSLHFEITITFPVQMIFDASGSDFAVSHLAVYSGLGMELMTDSDQDGVLTLTLPGGDFRFTMTGNVQTSSTYHVKLRCITEAPTRSPTQSPTKTDVSHVTTTTKQPTYAPVHHPITAHPSSSPVKEPSKRPANRPTPGEWTITSASQETENTFDSEIATQTEAPQKEGIQMQAVLAVASYIIAGATVICFICSVVLYCGCKRSAQRFTKPRRQSEHIVNIKMQPQPVAVPRRDIRQMVLLPPFPDHLQAANRNIDKIMTSNQQQNIESVVNHEDDEDAFLRKTTGFIGLGELSGESVVQEVMMDDIVNDMDNPNHEITAGSAGMSVGELQESDNMNIMEDEFVIRGDDDPVGIHTLGATNR